ncbi:MAG: M56 family metallopeptidase [Saprospiraceae bacterium]
MIPNFSLLFGQNILDALGMVFLHSLWQFTVIATILSWFIKKNIVFRSPARYAISLLTMTSMVLTAILTFFYYFEFETVTTINPNIFIIDDYFTDSTFVQSVKQAGISLFEIYQPWVLSLWMFGVVLLGVKLTGSLIYIEWLKKKAHYPGNENTIFQQWQTLRNSLGIQKNIRLGFSNHIDSPVLVGQIKPLILFPFSLINHLNPREVEFILLHELAHYARCDWWANVLQSIVEVVFYYHPAVYYVSRIIREQRENCCDEYAIQTLGGDQINYAKTLIKLQESSLGNTPGMALAFAHKNQIFVDRIKNILKMNQRKNTKNENILIGLIIVTSLLFASKVTIANHLNFQKSSDYLSHFFDFKSNPATTIDSIPVKKEKMIIIKKEDEKEVKVEMENGEIKLLEIDGKKIAPEEYHKYKEETKDIKMKTIRRHEGPGFGVHVYGMGDKDFEWNGNIDMNFDSLFQGIDWANSEERKIWSENMKREMKEMKEGLKQKNFHFFHSDSMMGHRFPEKQMKFYFNDDEHDFEDERVFEFEGSGDHNMVKKYRFNDGGELLGKRTVSEVLGSQLSKDGFLLPNQENKVELTGKYLKINGEKQPSNIWNKYKRIFEVESGTILEKKSKISFSFQTKEKKKKMIYYK